MRDANKNLDQNDRARLRLVHGTSPEVACRREVQELVARTGKLRPRQLASVRAAVTHPTGGTLKLMRALKDARLGFLVSWRIAITPQAKALAAMHGVNYTTGDFEPPPAAPERRAA